MRFSADSMDGVQMIKGKEYSERAVVLDYGFM
jgi:hypothetical protein